VITGQQLAEWIGENPYNIDRSYDMVQLLNRYAEDYGMDIVFLFGHDHSRWENELLLKEGDTIVSTQSYGDRSFGEQTVHFTYAHAGYLSTVIGSADSKFSLICRDGNKLQYDLIRTTDSEELHTEIPSRYQADYASVEAFEDMAKIDYEKKTGIAVYPQAVRNTDGTVTITLSDASGKTLETYTLDAKTGTGRDANGGEVNLPQTGLTSWDTAVTVGGAIMLFAAGAWLTHRVRKRERTSP
jgi:LPXTG-motif cell wall-anchored protein